MIDTPEADSTDTGLKVTNPEALARRWSQQIELAEKDRRDFIDDGKKVVKRYRNDSEKVGRKRLKGVAILYSNTEMLQAALYGKAAKPDVRRRYADRDPAGQAAAQIIERALSYTDDEANVDAVIEAAIQDFLLPGQGVVRLSYEPVFDQRPVLDPLTGMSMMDVDEDGETTVMMEDFIADQKIHYHYVYWQDFFHSPARNWEGVWWVAFRETMTTKQVQEEIYDKAPPSSKTFGKASDVPLNWKPTRDDGKPMEGASEAEIFQIWDQTSERRIWFVKGMPKPLRVDPDPYELQGFFPLPEPIAGYRTTESMIPMAPYKAYEDQADDLDEIARRISILTKALKRRGVYNQAIAELKRLAHAADNEYIPSPNFKSLQTSGGLAENFLTEDISPIVKVLSELYTQRDMLVQQIYEITGIADIMRGSSDPDETLGAQNLKAQFGSQRLKRQQRSIQKWIRDLNRIKAEMICQHFEPDVLSRMTDIEVTPEIFNILRSDEVRGYRVDIETDSTVYQDAAQQQQERTQLVGGIVQLFQAMGPMVPQYPPLFPFMAEMAKFALAPAHDARTLEDAIDELMQAVQQQPPKPPAGEGQQGDPAAAQKAQIESIKVQAMQAKSQAEAQKAQASIGIAQIGAQAEVTKAQLETQQAALSVQAQREAHAQDLAHRQQQHELDMAHMAHQHELAMQAKEQASKDQRMRGADR